MPSPGPYPIAHPRDYCHPPIPQVGDRIGSPPPLIVGPAHLPPRGVPPRTPRSSATLPVRPPSPAAVPENRCPSVPHRGTIAPMDWTHLLTVIAQILAAIAAAFAGAKSGTSAGFRRQTGNDKD